MFIRENIRAISSLGLPDSVRRKVYYGNAVRMLRLSKPKAPRRKARVARKK